MIQELHSHLNVRRLSSDDHQSLALPSSRSRCAVHPDAHSAWLHDLDLTRTHMPDLVDLCAALPDDASHEIIRDVDLLCLELLGRSLRAT